MKRPPLAGWLRHAVRSAWSWITHAVRSAWSWINAVPAWSWITIWVVLVVIAVSVISIMCWDWLSSESNGSTIRNIVLGAAAIIALPLAIWRSKVAERQAATAQRQSETAQRGLLNERHRKGVDMLGSEKLTVRLGGIYALAWLAREYPGDYHTQIMRLFCVFVREASEARVRKDVRAVMTAVGMRSSSQIETEKKEMGYPLDSGSPKALWFGRSIDASTLHPECIQGCQTPVWTRSDHEAAFRGRSRITHAPWPSQAWKRRAIGKPFREPPMANHGMLWSPESNGYPTKGKIPAGLVWCKPGRFVFE